MNILVIDDEPLIHISIEKLIHIYSKEIQVYHAYNGNEMLAALSKRDYLLAFVDIKMPGLTGLEAVRMAKEIAPMTRYYIMSGFDEFEYAKQAIKLKVDDYLLKPLDLKTIQETIEAAIQLDHAAKRERKTIFRNWLESTLNHRDGSLEKYSDYYYSLLLVTIDNPDFPKEALLEKLRPYTDNYVSSFVRNQILLLCFSQDSNVLQNIRQKLSTQTYSDGITFFTSSILHNTSSLKQVLEQLLRYSCLRVLLGIEKFYFLKPLLNHDPELLSFGLICLSWQTAYQDKNYTDFVNQSDMICIHLKNQEILKKYLPNIFQFFAHTLNKATLPPIDSTELQTMLRTYAKRLFPSTGSEKIVHSIIQYIQAHYCENISASSLAERFNLSANYISNLIKQELGIRYNDYITQLRLNHAKMLLLSTNQSVKDITAACGYFSQSHFTKLFIEHMGCTPTEYRKKNSK